MTLEHESKQMTQATQEPIAVIGIGCRFAGGSNSPEAFWQMLAEGRDAVEKLPLDRYDIDQFYDPDLQKPGKTLSKWGSFLSDIDKFDASFFGIAPREAIFIDPLQRILLEVTWEALERAGLPPKKLEGTATGVYVGLFNKDYSDRFTEQMVNDRAESANRYMATGIGSSFAAGRISYLLGLHGPSMTIDTVCSSSLVAIHLACQSLRTGETNVALAGAVELNFAPLDLILSSKMRVLSPTGRCRTFDAGADGFVRGEGCGVVVLKRYSDALADGDNIVALIRGSALNHDGRSKGMLAPNGKAQEAVLQKALQNAGVTADQISYIEAHGTGTKLGDPIEFEVLKKVIGQAHPEGSVCMIGSVKTNIGHLLAAAGMAGLVKTIMAMKHQAIPPHLHLKTLNPSINLENTPFVIPKELTRWSVSSGPRFAGVSASGLSGTNSHIVLEEVLDEVRTDNQQPPTSQITGETWLLPLSAKTTDGLRQLARTWCSELRLPEGQLSNAPLHHICSTASLRRDHYQERLALVAGSHAELAMHLEAFLEEKVAPGISCGSALISSKLDTRPVFIFSGQGTQWPGMGQELFKQEQVFRTALEKCDSLLRRHVSWSLLEELQADEAQSRLHETAISQAAIVSVQVALFELWRSWGIEPAAVVGHSVGEISAAYVAGALDLEDTMSIVAQRGALMQEAHGLGYMAAVEISESQAREYLANYTGKVAIAAVNSPTSVVLSGETTALDKILQKMLQIDNIVARKLNVESAFHSPQMERFRIPLVESLKGIKPRPAKIPLFSTVTGEPGSGEDCDAAYWGRNMCQAVFFGPAMENLLNKGYGMFVEVSPHPVLARSVKQSFVRHERSGLQVLSSLRRGMSERTTMLAALGSLYANGSCEVKWEQILLANGAQSYKVVSLPTYPWQRTTFWFTDKKPLAQSVMNPAQPAAPPAAEVPPPSSRLTGHPLLALRVRSATRDNIFETTISTKTYPWLADHESSGITNVPGSAFIEMMHESVRMALNYEIVRLRDVYIHQGLILLPGQSRVVQLVLQSTADNPSGEIQILSCPENDHTDEWTLHASGYYLPDRPPAPIATVADYIDLDAIKKRCPDHTEGRKHYQLMQVSGFEYGPAFQGMKQIWATTGESLGQLCLPQQLASEQGSYFMHPAFLDACVQTAAAAVAVYGTDTMYIPLSMDGVFFYQRPGKDLWVHATVTKSDFKQGLIIVDVQIFSERGEPVALIEGLHLWRTTRSALAGQKKNEETPDWLLKIQWDLKAYEGTVNHEGKHMLSSVSPRSWLLFCDKSGTGTQLAKDLRDRGEQCFLVFADQLCQNLKNDCEQYTLDPSNSEHFHKFLQECVPVLKHTRCSIVFLWAMDTVASAEEPLEQLLQGQQRLCGGLLHLVQAVVHQRWASSPQLWVMTQNSQDVSSGIGAGICAPEAANASSVVQAPLWGLGRVIALEHPDLNCRLVDLPDHKSWDRETFIKELLSPEPEDHIAIRKEGRYIARLTVAEPEIAFQNKLKQQDRATFQADHKVVQFSATGTYLITGGLGGLGIATAQWMVEKRGARHLVLTGRRAPTPEVLLVLRQLERHGAQILVVQADVSDQNQVAELLKTIQQVGLPLRGIIHTAGVIDDGLVMNQNWARFAKVFGPKVQGSWNLHLLTRHIPLDFFAIFSSAASFVPAPGQASYAAANAFMDEFAHYRRSLGLPAVSIDWGAWADVGMTKGNKSYERRMEQLGVHLIGLEQGMLAFEQVLLDNPIQIAVLPVNWPKFTNTRNSPFFSTVRGEQLPQQPKQVTISSTVTANEAQALIKEPYVVRFHERPQILLEDVSRQVKKILGLDANAKFDYGTNLFDMGVDSFMAVDLRNALQRETALSLSANLVFDHPTVEAIAAHLATRLTAPAPK